MNGFHGQKGYGNSQGNPLRLLSIEAIQTQRKV